MAGESGGHPECAWRACVTPLGLGALERQQCLCSVNASSSCEQAYVEGSKRLRIRDEQGALWGSTNRYEESSGVYYR